MSPSARLGWSIAASFILSGCATQTAQTKTAPTTIAATREEEPESSRDHWMRRELEDKGERIFEPANSR